jgi:hypothetical protein
MMSLPHQTLPHPYRSFSWNASAGARSAKEAGGMTDGQGPLHGPLMRDGLVDGLVGLLVGIPMDHGCQRRMERIPAGELSAFQRVRWQNEVHCVRVGEPKPECVLARLTHDEAARIQRAQGIPSFRPRVTGVQLGAVPQQALAWLQARVDKAHPRVTPVGEALDESAIPTCDRGL